MKKSFLAILLTIVLCLSIVVFAACPAEEGPDNDAPVPVEEGKITFYFTLGEDTAEQLPDIVSYYMAGGVTGWTTGIGAWVFEQYEDTNYYYVITEAVPDPDATQGLEYQLVVGYNEKSGVAGDSQGLLWIDDRKSDHCASFAYPDNPTFEYTAGDQVIDLGVHNFTISLPAPLAIDTTLMITFAEPLPEEYEVRIAGSFNDWGSNWGNKHTVESDAKYYLMKVSEDRLSASLLVEEILVSNYSFKVNIYMTKQDVTADDYNFWTDVGRFEFVPEGTPEGENGSFSLGAFDNNNVVRVIQGIVPPIIEIKDIDTTLKIVFDKALPEGSIVHIYGGFNGWAYVEGNCELTSTDGTTWTIELNQVTTGMFVYKILVFPAGTTSFGWDGGGTEYGGPNGANLTELLLTDHEGESVTRNLTVAS